MTTAPSMATRYPAALLAEREAARASDDLRTRVRWDLTPRPAYAFGLLAAADIARFCGIRRLAAVELGVAGGEGLLAMCDLAAQVTAETGVAFDIFGLDGGVGLPPLDDYRDHLEIWSEGDFVNPDREGLVARLPANARMMWGDVRDTVGELLALMTPERPLGFVSNDLDVYRSTRDAMALFRGAPEHYLPVVPTYFDDTLGGAGRIGSLFRNRWAGQLLAIDEFNAETGPRKIDSMRILKYRRPMAQEQWIEKTYGLHVLDHPLRNAPRDRRALMMGEHGADESLAWPF